MTDLIPFVNPDAPDTPDAHSWTPSFVKKVTITDRDDAYLATLLGNDLGIDLGIDLAKRMGVDLDDIQFEGDDIFGYTPPVPTSTREWLLLALAAKLAKLNAPAQSVKTVIAPGELELNASLEAVVSQVNVIVSKLIEAGVFHSGR